MDTPAKYDAFISYRHRPLDKAVAEKLQRLLEAYRPPRGGSYAVQRISRVFRDQSELSTGALDANLKKALEDSRFLIVICSEETKNSHFCMEEIEYFKQLHDGSNDNILTLLVSGDPNEVFPDSLRYEKRKNRETDGTENEIEVAIEPLAADVRGSSVQESLKLLKWEFLRIAAPILGCDFDDLYRRHQRLRMHQVIQISASILTAVIAVSVYIVYSQLQINDSILKEQEQKALVNEKMLIIDNEKITRALIEAQDLIDRGDKIAASRSLLDIKDNSTHISTYVDSQIESMLYQSTYVPKYGQYAVLDNDTECFATEWNGDILYAATMTGDLSAWNTTNGTKLWIDDFSEIIYTLKLYNGLLYSVTNSSTVLVIDADSGAVAANYAFDTNYDELSELVFTDIIVYNNTIYICEFDKKSESYQIISVDTVTNESKPVFNSARENSSFLDYCYFDRTSNRMIGVEQGNTTDCFTFDFFTKAFEYYEYDYTLPSNRSFYYNEANAELSIFYKEHPSDVTYRWNIDTFSLAEQTTQTYVVENEYAAIFMFDDIRAACFSPNGRYMVVGEYNGNIFYFDTKEQKIENQKDLSAVGIPEMQFVDDNVLFISFGSGDTNTLLVELDYQTESDIDSENGSYVNYTKLENIIGQSTCSTSPKGNTMALVNSNGNINLYNLGDASIEKKVKLTDEVIEGTNDNDSVTPAGGEDEIVVSVSADGNYRLVILSTEEKPESGLLVSDSVYNASWVVDNHTGERLYNAIIPFTAFRSYIRDFSDGTLLTEGYFLYDINLKTGEISRTTELKTDFNNSEISSAEKIVVKFAVDYDNDKIIFVTKYDSNISKYKTRGVVLSLTTGDVLFEFSDVMGNLEVGFDPYNFDMYKYSIDRSEAIALHIPTYSELIDIASRQVAGENNQIYS
jgi:hypothetical protein